MGFEVSWSGSFLYGSGPMAKLSRSDLNDLSEMSSAVATQNLSAPKSCVSLPPVVGRSDLRVYLTEPDGIIRLVYHLNTSDNTLCWVGNQSKAEGLATELDSLSNQYQP
jgi:hypothetical protein